MRTNSGTRSGTYIGQSTSDLTSLTPCVLYTIIMYCCLLMQKITKSVVCCINVLLRSMSYHPLVGRSQFNTNRLRRIANSESP